MGDLTEELENLDLGAEEEVLQLDNTTTTSLISFENCLKDENSQLVDLNLVGFWVLSNDVPVGFISEQVAKQLGNFIGVFIEFDAKAVTLGYKGSLQFCVLLDVRKPLKKKKKIALPNEGFYYVKFQYEKLRVLCFLCGKLGHGEGSCLLRVLRPKQELIPQWDISLRALPRHMNYSPIPWLQDDNGQKNKDNNNLEGVNAGLNSGLARGNNKVMD
ncbi:uncharacterized protein LOC120147892 [Hibiscus syriacus]|uniref:uncharacterized protein LOC120147892 n=1 Tax=Hibiscus syriacus TaxID=106335 RepID=UPI0019249187|nr:uncharacterized protein LOC120147892 [Hibiscus syriacus]